MDGGSGQCVPGWLAGLAGRGAASAGEQAECSLWGKTGRKSVVGESSIATSGQVDRSVCFSWQEREPGRERHRQRVGAHARLRARRFAARSHDGAGAALGGAVQVLNGAQLSRGARLGQAARHVGHAAGRGDRAQRGGAGRSVMVRAQNMNKLEAQGTPRERTCEASPATHHPAAPASRPGAALTWVGRRARQPCTHAPVAAGTRAAPR